MTEVIRGLTAEQCPFTKTVEKEVKGTSGRVTSLLCHLEPQSKSKQHSLCDTNLQFDTQNSQGKSIKEVGVNYINIGCEKIHEIIVKIFSDPVNGGV